MMLQTLWEPIFGLQDGGASYSAFLKTLLPPATVDAALAGGAAGMAQVGGAYMMALADKFHGAIDANALNKGAMRVAVLNMPGIDKTPRLQQLLGGIAASAGLRCQRPGAGLVRPGLKPSTSSWPHALPTTARWSWSTSTPHSTTRLRTRNSSA